MKETLVKNCVFESKDRFVVGYYDEHFTDAFTGDTVEYDWQTGVLGSHGRMTLFDEFERALEAMSNLVRAGEELPELFVVNFNPHTQCWRVVQKIHFSNAIYSVASENGKIRVYVFGKDLEAKPFELLGLKLVSGFWNS